jgi:hypothetical protein
MFAFSYREGDPDMQWKMSGNLDAGIQGFNCGPLLRCCTER